MINTAVITADLDTDTNNNEAQATLSVCSNVTVVQNNNDSGSGSLRQNIADACPGAMVTFNGDYTIMLDSLLSVDKELTIDGGGHRITIDGQDSAQLFRIESSAVVTLSHLTLANGYGEGSGGAIFNNGTLTIMNSALIGNRVVPTPGPVSAASGGAIYNGFNKTLTVINSTFSANRLEGGMGASIAEYGGGAIFSYGTVTINNSTFSDNWASGNKSEGSSIFIALGTLNLHNSIIANSTSGSDCFQDGGTINLTNTLIEDGTCTPTVSGDPMLSALADHGGDTQTYALQTGSPALDAGHDGTCEMTDQRGIPRPQRASCDLGAFELEYHQLTVTLAGDGSGVISSDPAGIACGADCDESLVHGTAVTLTASYDNSQMALTWGGSCSAAVGDSCIVMMEQAHNVIATFTLGSFSLGANIAGNGSGAVSSNPAGINCDQDGGICNASFTASEVITLTAVPETGSTFMGWSGACADAGDCVVIMDRAKEVTATFTLNQYELIVSLEGTGSGSVTSTPSGIDCQSDCSKIFDYGTVVTLTAVADMGTTFSGWSGSCTNNTGDCVVTIDEAENVSATFTLDQYELDVSLDGTGIGSVASIPSGINCEGDCSEIFDYGTVVTLTAVAETGSTFTGWSGVCTGSDDCVVTMDSAQNVTATFALDQYELNVSLEGTGSGLVTSIPSGIDCGVDCTELFDYGTVVTLTAVAEPGSTFIGWSGICSGTGDCMVMMTQARSATASFTLEDEDYTIFLPMVIRP